MFTLTRLCKRSPYINSFQVCMALLLLLLTSANSHAKNGFDLSTASIPLNEIHHGGPQKDGIPAIDAPKFVRANTNNYLHDNDWILGINIDGVARAYPILIMNWHEVVNDHSQATPLAITFCPLYGTGMAFVAGSKDAPESFGVSGLLFQSDVLLYDRSSESLWSQIMRKAVAGKKTGQQLEQVPLAHMRWSEWRKRHPDSLILSTDTGTGRLYFDSPYRGYEQSEQLFFEVRHRPPPPYHPKERVLGFTLNDKAIAFPFSELSKHGKTTFEYTWQSKALNISWNEAAGFAEIKTSDGTLLTSTIAFWFAWHTFHPDGKVFKAKP